MKKIKLSLFALGMCAFIFTGCDKDKNPEPTKKGKNAPIVLDCNYFNEDRILVDDPEADVDYVIKCRMVVSADIKIEPGVVIEFEQEAGINIEENPGSGASLSAIGTSGKPIIFRGVKKEKGFWTGLRFDSKSPKNELNHIILADAGYYINYGHAWSGGIRASASNLKISNSTISNCASYGVNVDNKFNAIASFKNNTLTKNDIAVKTHPLFIGIFDATSKYSGNVDDFIFVNGYAGPTDKDFTWHKVDVPYKLDNVLDISGNMIVEAGVEIIMTPNSGMRLGSLEKEGSFVMKGTPSNKIIIRGEEDVAGYWNTLYVRSNSTKNEMAHMEIRNGGLVTNDPSPATIRGVMYLSGAFLNIHDSKFINSFGCALDVRHNTILNFENIELVNTSCLGAP